MITEVMKISEPPYTNRGVTRQKEDLTALIDWCQITVKGVDVFIIIEDILRIPLSFMELHGKEKGIAGHELIARFDNIKILKPTGNAQYEGFQILMSGSGCRNYENFLMMNKETWFDFLERVCRYPVNFPRIDLAIDDTKPYLSIPELIRLKNEGLISSQLRDTAENRSDRLKEDEIEAQGKTLYLGSKHSDFRITFYEKGYEQAEKFGKELNPDWNRYELRFRHKKAVRLVEELLKDRAVFTEAGKQHGYKKTALSYLSPVGRTHAGCREDKVDHESREKDTGTNMAVAERSSFALFKANG